MLTDAVRLTVALADPAGRAASAEALARSLGADGLTILVEDPAVEALVRAKLEGGEVTHLEKEEPKKGEVVDLLAALQRSVDAAKTSRGEAPAEEPAEAPVEPVSDTPATGGDDEERAAG